MCLNLLGSKPGEVGIDPDVSLDGDRDFPSVPDFEADDVFTDPNGALFR